MKSTRILGMVAIAIASLAFSTVANAQDEPIRPDRSPVNPNEFDKIRPPQSPVNPNEFKKIRPPQSPVNPNTFRTIDPDRGVVIDPDDARVIDPDRGTVINPDGAPTIDPDQGLVIDPDEDFADLEELAPIREAGAVHRARQFQSAFSKVQEQAREVEPGSEALPLQENVEELTRGAEELSIRFTRVGRDFDDLGYTARANRAEEAGRLFQELQARLALYGLELVQRGDVTTIPNDLEFNFELIEEALIGFPEF